MSFVAEDDVADWDELEWRANDSGFMAVTLKCECGCVRTLPRWKVGGEKCGSCKKPYYELSRQELAAAAKWKPGDDFDECL